MSFSKFSQAVSVLSCLESSSNVSLLCTPFLFCMRLCIFAPFGAAVWSWLKKTLLHPELWIHVYNDSNIVCWLQMYMLCFSQTAACHNDVLSMAEALKSRPTFHTRRRSCVAFFFFFACKIKCTSHCTWHICTEQPTPLYINPYEPACCCLCMYHPAQGVGVKMTHFPFPWQSFTVQPYLSVWMRYSLNL